MRMERKAWTVTVQANDEFPDAPTDEAVKDVDARYPFRFSLVC